MKTFLLATILCIATHVSFAQDTPCFYKGSTTVSVGYGFINFEGIKNEVYATKHFGTMYGKSEHALSDRFGWGVNVAYMELSGPYGNWWYPVTEDNADVAAFSALLRANLHLVKSRRLDWYFGGGIGYQSTYVERRGVHTNSYYDYYTQTYTVIELPFVQKETINAVGMDATVGANYYLGETIALYAEAGIAKSFLQGGMTFRF